VVGPNIPKYGGKWYFEAIVPPPPHHEDLPAWQHCTQGSITAVTLICQTFFNCWRQLLHSIPILTILVNQESVKTQSSSDWPWGGEREGRIQV
jgi:hypothetical protein